MFISTVLLLTTVTNIPPGQQFITPPSVPHLDNGRKTGMFSNLPLYVVTLSRDCQGFQNPQGSGVRVHEGKGMGWDFVPS